MNRLAINIAIFLGLILLLCVVLERLGMGDVVKDAGARVREKAGISNQAHSSATKPDFTNEIEKLLGASIHDIQRKPIEMQKVAKKKILAEIERLKSLQISAKSIEMNVDARTRENEVRRKDLIALLAQAKAAVDDPNTEYPVKIGNFFYESRQALLSVAVDLRRETDRLEAENAEIMNVSPSAVRNARAIANHIDELEKALAQLQTIPLLAGGAQMDGEVEELRETVRPWTSVPASIKAPIPDPRGREDGSREPTEAENYTEAFGQ